MKKLITSENLIYLTIFSLPLYLVRFSILGVPTNVLEVLIGVAFVFSLVETPRRGVSTWRESYSSYKVYIFYIVLLFLGLFSSLLAGNNYLVSSGIIKSWFVLPLIFFLTIILSLPKDKFINVWKFVYFSAITVAIIALGYKVLGFVTYDGRLEVFFNSPNYLAMYLSPGVIIGIQKIQELSSWKRFGSLIIIVAALYFTYSYAAWLAIAISIGIVYWLIYKEAKPQAGGLVSRILIYLIILFVLFISQGQSSKFNDFINFDERSSLSSRMMIWRASAKILEDNWIFGIGAENFQEKYLEYQKYFPPYLEWAVPHPHNVFLAFWLFAGILGLAGFLGLIFLRLKNSFQNNKKTPLELVSFGVLVYILLHGLVDTTYFKNDLAMIFWLCFLHVKPIKSSVSSIYKE